MTDPTITIRHAEPSDYEALHKMFTHPKAIRGTLQLPYPSVESWRKRLSESPVGFYSLVACAREEVVGQLGLPYLSHPTTPEPCRESRHGSPR